MLYPIVVDLRGRDVLVVGGGAVAERKIRRLLEAEANVRVVAREPCAQVAQWAVAGSITLRIGDFTPEELGTPLLVFAATNEPETNNAVARLAGKHRVLANSAAGDELDFVVPAAGWADGLGVAVWSGSPALSVALRDVLLAQIDERWRLAGRVFDTLRITLHDRGDVGSRGALWRNLAAGVPQEFRTVAVAKRFVRAVARGAGLPIGKAESDALFEVAEE